MINSKNHLRETGKLIETVWTLFFWHGFEKCVKAKKEEKVAALINLHKVRIPHRKESQKHLVGTMPRPAS